MFCQYSANNCFFMWTIAKVATLLKNEFGVKLVGSVADQLLQAIMHILGCTEAEALPILELRIGSQLDEHEEYEDLATSEECMEYVEKRDQKAWKENVVKCADKKLHAGIIKEAIFAKLREAKGATVERKPIMTPLPADDASYTVKFVETLVPSNTTVTKDPVDNRWRFFFRLAAGGRANISRSWGRWGSHQEAVRQCLLVIWEHSKIRGEICNLDLSPPA